MKTAAVLTATGAAALLAAGSALAHPGHGIAQLGHLLTEPDHLTAILLPLVIGLGWLLWRYFTRR